MTTEDKLVRDIEGLRESMRLNGEDLKKGLISAPAAVEHGKWCLTELSNLLRSLEEIQKAT